jgi:predicted DsbA family dithiol-disulfide isomerase
MAAGTGVARRMTDEAVELDVFYDFHCPYCYRAVEWLDRLTPEVVAPRYRLFALEQVNRDPEADAWRLWEQPLDYRHYRERQDRRPLAPFLAMANVEAVEPPEIIRRFRLGVFAARFDDEEDVTDVGRLARVLDGAGGDGDRLRDRIDDAAADVAARVRIATDWATARGEFAIFGVPTLRLEGARRPFYLRLEQRLTESDGRAFWARFRDLVEESPYLLEVKAADRREPD